MQGALLQSGQEKQPQPDMSRCRTQNDEMQPQILRLRLRMTAQVIGVIREG
jgi:hypothetical protein